MPTSEWMQGSGARCGRTLPSQRERPTPFAGVGLFLSFWEICLLKSCHEHISCGLLVRQHRVKNADYQIRVRMGKDEWIDRLMF